MGQPRLSLFIFVLFKQKFYRKDCRHQWDSNSDHQLEGEHADHLITTTGHMFLLLMLLLFFSHPHCCCCCCCCFQKSIKIVNFFILFDNSNSLIRGKRLWLASGWQAIFITVNKVEKWWVHKSAKKLTNI